MTLPEHVRAQFGELVYVKTREILPNVPLVAADPREVLHNISAYGFHIQIVEVKTEISEAGAAIGGGVLGASLGGPVGALIGALIGYGLAQHAKDPSNAL